MYVYGELLYADLHNRDSDPSSAVRGRLYWNYTSGKAMLDDGTNVLAFLRNDQKIIIGSSATSSQNIRLNRAAAGVLQFVTGDDTTAQGTLSTSLAKLSFAFESYATGSLPAAGVAGRMAWDTTTSTPKFDNGASWSWSVPVATGITGLGTGVATFLATPSSANLAAALTDETGSGAAVFATSPTLVTPILGTPQSGNLSSCTAYPFSSLTGTASSSQVTTATFVAPTVQKFTSGSGTYTLPSSPRAPLYIRVRMVGGGGGGGPSGTASGSAGGNGGNTTFGSSLLEANGGTGGGALTSSVGGAGGTVSLGSGPSGTALVGGKGGGGQQAPNTATSIGTQLKGGDGAASAFGGAGTGGYGVAGSAGATNTGAGGGGGGTNTAADAEYAGVGGGAGGFVDAIITSPSSTYAYSVGAAGTAGGAGTNGYAGGAGGSGYIEVTEYYQ